uniref:ribosomal protein S16 n=1 Tax=Pterothamnion plumula TaxID=173462 RepID=UPI0020291C36|nr:ribosomal protein S16 [Pterothamnion plumula]UPO65099.1 ribosomal protein S16 [Pterothamnion plumula]
MLKIRLKRLGRKKRASYRIIVIDSKKRRDGKALEEIGFYNPLTKETKLNIESIKSRLQQGAQLTPIVKFLMDKTLNHQ